MDATGVVGLVLFILVTTLVILGVIFGAVYFVVRGMANKNVKIAEQEYPNARHIESGPQFFGQQSKGVTQARGNGTMIFTDSEIIFKQWVVNKEFRIPYRSITAIENPTSFLGKTQFAPLLKIVYTDEQGQTDSMAWRVRELSKLTLLIEEGRAKA